MKRHAAMAQREDTVTEYPWGELHTDYSDERYRFVFDGKPEQAVIDMMKRHAFKWSRSNQAWQRQMTANAKWAVERIIKELNERQEQA